MGRDTVQLKTAVTTISQEYLLEFTSEYGISEALYPKLPGPEDRIVDFPEGNVGVYTRVDVFQQEAREKYPSMLYQAIRFPKKLEQPLLLGGRKGILDYSGLAYKCSEGWDASREYLFPEGCDDIEHTSHPNPEITRSTTLLSRVEPQILPRRQDMDLFSLIRASNPTKVKTGTRPRAAHEVPLLTVTASRVIEMEDPAAATDSSGVPSTIERSPLDFANENPSPSGRDCCHGSSCGQRMPQEGQRWGRPNAPPKVLRRDHADPRPTESTRGGKSLATIELGMGSTRQVPASQDVTQSSKGAAVAGDPESENTSFTSMIGSPESIYRPEWGIMNGCLVDAPEACQDLQYNVNLARQVAMGSQLRLRFEQEAKLLKKSIAQVARRDKRIQARENEIKNLETLLEAETDMKKVTEGRSAELSKELENTLALFLDLQVSNNRLSQQVSTLQAQVMGEEKLKAAFEEFKQYEDNRVEQHCAKIDARLDGLSIDFDEELYPHMLTAIADVVSAGIAKGMSEGLMHGVEHEKANLSLEAIEAYDSESDTGDDAPQWIHELRLSSSQLTISVYLEARDPTDPWACKEEILLADAIAANISRAEKKKKCRVVCRTHRVGSAHHARYGVSVSVPTVSPQGLAILLVDAATQNEISEDGASPRLVRSSSLPVMYN
uniref:Transposase (Putative), gypsy type n=1 Tax=Tanacetum cinerariifolium TaxID=118510 RepID=A0A699GQJ7_TANCI|nr:hypothetical protein [Tanacetum cinerariifolium]